MPTTDWATITLFGTALFGVSLLVARIWLDRRRGTVRPRAWLETALGMLLAFILLALLISNSEK